MKDKELSLIFDFKNAPAELQAAATKHNDNAKALNKKKASLDAAQVEFGAAQDAYNSSQADFKKLLKEWTPGV